MRHFMTEGVCITAAAIGNVTTMLSYPHLHNAELINHPPPFLSSLLHC